MSIKESHQKRVEGVKRFVSKNKLFVVIAVITVCYLLINFIINKNNNTETSIPKTSVSQSETVEEAEESEDSADKAHWRFYWIDLWILVGAGGFCTVMIIRERRKAREKIQ